MNDTWSNAQMVPTMSARRKRLMSATLWAVQGVLTFLFLFTGGVKLILPIAALQAQLPFPLPGLFIRVIGVIEVAGALGVLLPSLTRIKPVLTPLAASGLALEMVGATSITALSMGVGPALMPLLVGLLAAWVAYGRRKNGRSV